MLNKIKNIGENNSTGITLVAIVILIIFLFASSLGNRGNSSKQKECVAPNAVTNSKTSYEYNVKILKNKETIILNIKKYKGKLLIEKTEKGLSSSYYLYYYNTYMKNEKNEYFLYNGDSFIEGIDNKLLFIDYLAELSEKGDILESDTKVCYVVDKLEKVCIYTDNSITYDKDDIHIEYDVYKTDNVSDFEVNVLDLSDENNNVVDEKINQNENNGIVKDETIIEDNNISE